MFQQSVEMQRQQSQAQVETLTHLSCQDDVRCPWLFETQRGDCWCSSETGKRHCSCNAMHWEEDSRGKTQAGATSIDASEEQSDSENERACGTVKRQHVEYIAGKRYVRAFVMAWYTSQFLFKKLWRYQKPKSPWVEKWAKQRKFQHGMSRRWGQSLKSLDRRRKMEKQFTSRIWWTSVPWRTRTCKTTPEIQKTTPEIQGAGFAPGGIYKTAYGNSIPHHHEDHIARKGDNSSQHFNLVHKFIPVPQAMKIPAANAAVEKECENWRKSGHGSWRKSETRKKWSMKQGIKAILFILRH